jgi:photosystem II stability/assembly factor-like uncharacterized protein
MKDIEQIEVDTKQVHEDSNIQGQRIDTLIDYSKRKRNLEWRQNWFYLDRFRDDAKFNHVLVQGLDYKRKLIEKQKSKAKHKAGYAPAGAGTPWFSIGPRNINGRVKSIAVHPTDANTIYAGAASGGVWKSTNGGASWKPLWDMQDTMAIGSLAVAPGTPNTIYAGTGEWTPGWGPSFPGTGVFVSTDGGTSWTQRTSVLARRIAKILVSQDNANHVYVAGESGFEKSTDGGVTWNTIHSGQISDAVIDPVDADVLYIAVRNDGIYKSTDAGATWTKLNNGPSGSTNANWLKLAIGDSGAHGSDFILAKQSGTINRSTDGGTTWTTLSGDHGGASYHQWCSSIAVAGDNEDIIIAGGVGIERTTNGGTSWSSLAGLHSDHHVTQFAPSDNNIVYSCNDGGVYRSSDKGATWKKVSNGLIVTQFYDIGSWSTIGTVLGGGTQDNGTNMSTGGLTWKRILGADGGYFVIHPSNPRIIYAETQNTALEKTSDGGNTWTAITNGLSGSSPWTGVLTIDVVNPDTLFVGTNAIFKTTDGCATAWAKVSQDLNGDVTSIAISESNPSRVLCGTTGGSVYHTNDGGATTTWTDITGTLPGRVIKDIVISHTDQNRIMVCLGGTSGSGAANGIFLSTNGGTTWTNISGNLPDISVNAVVFDPNNTNTLYAGTDVGVFRTTDLGVSWEAFDNGIPNVIITDLAVDRIGNMLFAATFGRGMYKVSILSAVEPEVDLYLRDSLLDTGERFPSPSNLPNPNDSSDQVYWWESPDIKVDVSPFYSPGVIFDGVDFDELTHEDPVRSQTNRFYLQVHNRGWQVATNVRVRAFLANASAGLPPLPNALTPPNFNLTSSANWTAIGPAITIPTLEPNVPVIVSWDYNVPSSAATHSCLLAVISSSDDPITTTETNVDLLINSEKRVCLKNLHVITVPGPQPQQMITTMEFHNARNHDDIIDILIDPAEFGEGSIGMLLQSVDFVNKDKALDGVKVYNLREGEDIGKLYSRGRKTEANEREIFKKIDLTKVYEFDTSKVSALRGIKLGAGQAIQGIITVKGSKKTKHGASQKFTVMQKQSNTIVGGSTYEYRLKRTRGLLPVSRIRIVLDKIRILDDHEPWYKGKADVNILSKISFNEDEHRNIYRSIPLDGIMKISDKPGKNEKTLGICLFDGYVGESDQLSLSIFPTERDTFDPDDPYTPFIYHFEGSPETWVGSYGPDHSHHDKEKMQDWMVWYTVQSLPLT